MRLFLASASLEDIRWAIGLGLIDGIVATPTVITTDFPNADAREVIADIARETPLPICVSVPAIAAAEIYKGARELAKIADHLVISVPFIEDAVPAIRRLSAGGVRVAATLVYSSAQGILAAKAGAMMVTVAIDALDAVGEDGHRVIADLREVYDHNATECDIAAAGPSSAAQFANCAVSGADVAIVTPPVLRALLQHPLTDRGLDRFLGDISRRVKPRRSR